MKHKREKTKKAPKKTVLEMHKVTRRYHLGSTIVEALKGIDVKICEGEYIAVMGPSGSGKSTMLNMLGCLDIPTSGKVLIDGIDIAKLSESELAQVRGKRIGFVFQTFFLVPHMSALENVELPMMFYDGDREERQAKAMKLLEKVGLGKRAGHKPNELSGGERQRVAIARAMINNPLILLADEPTGNLDTKSGKAIMDIFNEFNKEGKTIITVTHDENIAKHARKIMRLRDGEIASIEVKK